MFIIILQLANSSIVDSFPLSTFDENCTIRHRFNSAELFTGVSLTLTNTNVAGNDIPVSSENSPGCAVCPVPAVPPRVTSVIPSRGVCSSPYEEYPSPPPMTPIVGTKNSNLASPLQMAGIDKLHAVGIRGKGMKIAFLDTGSISPSGLGGGFGMAQNRGKVASWMILERWQWKRSLR
jgi:hypothetical protein